MAIGGAECEMVALGSLEIQVRGILPRHADAAVELDALFRGVHGDIAAVGLRHSGGDRGVRIAARVGVGRVTRGRTGGTDF